MPPALVLLPPWVLPAGAILLALLALALLWRWWREPTVYLEAVESLLTPAERRFHETLRRAVPDDWQVLVKVRIADVIRVTSEHAPSRQRVFRSISSKHVDFVLADRKSLRPVAAVELDDSSHRRRDRRKRDVLVDRVFATASLPLVRVPAAARYRLDEIAEVIERATAVR